MTVTDEALALLRAVRDGEVPEATERSYFLAGCMAGMDLLELGGPGPGFVQITDIYAVRLTDKGVDTLAHPEAFEFEPWGRP